MRNRAATGIDTAVVDLWKREVGHLSPRNFALRLAAPEDLVRRLEIFRNLEKHRGCVNTVSFNHDGDILVSGSDDKRLILWDWQSGKIKLDLHSGHNNNVFQAKFMPYTDDQCIVTSAADGQIRCTYILPHGKAETKLLAKHLGQVHKLAIEPGSPHIFYSCGEDGRVQRIDLRTGAATGLFTCQPLRNRSYMSYIHLNAIAIDPRNSNLFAVAGSDVYARLFDLRNCKFNNSLKFGQPVDLFCPSHLVGDNVDITGLAFSDQSELLVSYMDELIYLFSKNMGLGPTLPRSSPLSESDQDDVSERPQAFKGHRNSETVKGVSFFGPKCEYVVSGSDCGRIFVWKKKDGELVNLLEGDRHVVNCIVSHPHTSVLASSGIETDIKIWTPKATEKRELPINVSKVSTSRPIDLFGFGSLDDDSDGEYFYDDDDDEYSYEVDVECDEEDIFTDLVDEDDSASAEEYANDDDDDDDMASDEVDGEGDDDHGEEEDCFCDPVDLSNTHDTGGHEDLDDIEDDDGEEEVDDDDDDDEWDEEIISDS